MRTAMGLERWKVFAERHRSVVGLTALLVTFAAVALLLDRPKGTVEMWLALPLFAAGAALFAWVLWPAGRPPEAAEPTLAARLIHRLTWRGRLVRLLPAFGVAIVVLDLAYNLLLSASPALQTEDTIVLLVAVSLFAYPFVPARFARERDFVVVFMVALFLVLVLPLLLARLAAMDFEQGVDSYSWTALAPETAWVLNLVGVPASVHSVLGATAPGLTFVTNTGETLTVVISTACSGIYSFGIFASAFAAFVLTEYERLDARVVALLALGLLTSYVANILRMVLIVLFGVYNWLGQDSLNSLLIAHSYLGWIIFLAWISLFWTVVFRFLVRVPGAKVAASSTGATAPRKHGVLCGICGDGLTPALPGYRCECGRLYHVACAATVDECLRCHARMPGLQGALPGGPKPIQ